MSPCSALALRAGCASPHRGLISAPRCLQVPTGPPATAAQLAEALTAYLEGEAGGSTA